MLEPKTCDAIDRIEMAEPSLSDTRTCSGNRMAVSTICILSLACLAILASIVVLQATAGAAGGSSSPAADEVSPVAISAGHIHIEPGEDAIFNGSNSTDNVGVVNWTWFFIYEEGDYTIYGERATFDFEEAGIYSVQLTVIDAAGNRNSTVFLLAVGDTQVQATQTSSSIGPWVWAIAGGTFILLLLFLLGFVHRAKPERPPGEDPYHLHW
jgi:hypothetical protein